MKDDAVSIKKSLSLNVRSKKDRILPDPGIFLFIVPVIVPVSLIVIRFIKDPEIRNESSQPRHSSILEFIFSS